MENNTLIRLLAAFGTLNLVREIALSSIPDNQAIAQIREIIKTVIEKMHAFMLPVTILYEAPGKPKAIVKKRIGRPKKEEEKE